MKFIAIFAALDLATPALAIPKPAIPTSDTPTLEPPTLGPLTFAPPTLGSPTRGTPILDIPGPGAEAALAVPHRRFILRVTQAVSHLESRIQTWTGKGAGSESIAKAFDELVDAIWKTNKEIYQMSVHHDHVVFEAARELQVLAKATEIVCGLLIELEDKFKDEGLLCMVKKKLQNLSKPTQVFFLVVNEVCPDEWRGLIGKLGNQAERALVNLAAAYRLSMPLLPPWKTHDLTAVCGEVAIGDDGNYTDE